jgi:hypothetical protein
MKLLRLVPTCFVCAMWNLVAGTPMPRHALGTVWFVSMPPALQMDRPFRFVFGRTGSTPYCG